MTDQHPITPPPELMMQWSETWHKAQVKHVSHVEFVTTQAARWAADQELEACCKWLDQSTVEWADMLHAVRRPKPPSLRESALAALGSIERGQDRPEDTDTIRRALEALPE